MRTLLRHTRTGLYFRGLDQWTSNPQLAYDFHFIDNALPYIQAWELKEVELVFAFDDPLSLTTVPLAKTVLNYAA
jgi:hypothetical protein